MDYPHYYFKISEEVVTPHVPWARPYAGRRPRVLYLVPFGTIREIVEIAQRADLPYDHVPLFPGLRFFGDGAHARWNPAELLRKKISAGRHDVAAVGSFEGGVIPDDAWERLLAQVERGKGLVLVHPVQPPLLLHRALGRAVPAPLPPLFRTGIPFEAARHIHEGTPALYRFGKGRIAVLSYVLDPSIQERPSHPWIASLAPREVNRDQRGDAIRNHEFVYDLLIRAILWAGGAEPPVRVVQFRPRGFLRDEAFPRHAIRREDLPNARWAVELERASAGAPRRLSLEVAIRNGWAEEAASFRRVFAFAPRGPDPRAAARWRGEGEGFREQFALDPRPFIRGLEGGNPDEILLPLPDLPPGPYTIELRALDAKGRAAAWAQGAFEVCARFSIGAVRADPPLVRDAIARGFVEVRNDGGPASPLLALEARDAHGRLVHREERAVSLPAGGGAIPFALPVARAIGTLARIRASLLRGKEPLAEGRGEAILPRPPRTDDWTVQVWSARNDCDHHFGPARLKRLRALGATQGMSNPYQVRTGVLAWMHARADLSMSVTELVPGQYLRVERREMKPPRDFRVRRPCLTDPAFNAMVQGHVRRWSRDLGALGVTDFLIGDEINYGIKPPEPNDFCRSPSCLAAFRADLKARYGRIAALNAAWGTHWRSFGAVVPPGFRETLGSPRRRPGWLEHRLHQTRVFLGFMERIAAEIRRTLPGSRFGVSGTQEPTIFNGYDWAGMMRLFDVVVSYSGIQDELIRSFRRPGTLAARWDGYDPYDENERRARWQPWYRLLHGCSGSAYYLGWSPGGGAPWQGVILPDLSPRNVTRWLKEDNDEIRGGIGRLLLGARRENSGIAILYSYPSLGAATAAAKGGEDAHAQGLFAWKEILEDSGFQYDFVSYLDLREGKADLSPYKVLLLPYGLALSEAEAAAIRRFAEEGGCVIADHAPGVFDERGVARRGGALEELFGAARRSYRPILQPGELALVRPPIEPRGSLFQVSGRASGPAPADPILRFPVPVFCGESSLQPRGAEPFGEVSWGGRRAPALLLRKAGRGEAILLNFSFRTYATHQSFAGAENVAEQVDRSPAGAAGRELLKALLAQAGLRPLFGLDRKDGGEVERVEKFVFTDGPARYAAFLKKYLYKNWWDREGPIQWELKEQAVLTLPAPGHLYDVRAGKYLGYGTVFRTSAVPAITRIFAVLPYAVRAVAVESLGPCAPGGRALLRARIEADRRGAGAPAGRHVFHVEASDARGRPRPEYQANVEAPSGEAEFSIDLALDDPEGTWTVEVRDAATGVRGGAQLEVKGATTPS